MPKFEQGFKLLDEERFREAHDYFVFELLKQQEQSVSEPVDPQSRARCLYGQARALMGLNDNLAAARILNDLIYQQPHWQTPYITLARLYESIGQLHSARATFDRAFEKTGPSQKLEEHYQYFILNYMKIPAATFTPAYAQQQRPSEQPAQTVTQASSPTLATRLYG